MAARFNDRLTANAARERCSGGRPSDAGQMIQLGALERGFGPPARRLRAHGHGVRGGSGCQSAARPSAPACLSQFGRMTGSELPAQLVPDMGEQRNRRACAGMSPNLSAGFPPSLPNWLNQTGHPRPTADLATKLTKLTHSVDVPIRLRHSRPYRCRAGLDYLMLREQ